MKEQILNVRYKWSKLFAAKRFGGKDCILDPIEQQELLDDLDTAAAEIEALNQLATQRTEELERELGKRDKKITKLEKEIIRLNRFIEEECSNP